MKDRIVEYLETSDKARTLMEINDALNLSSVDDLQNLQNTLEELIKEGIVHETKKSKYILMKNCASLHTGKIDIAKSGYAFLMQDNGENDIFISKDNLNGAIEGDTALVDVFTRNGKQEGTVIKILDRKLKNIVGEILFEDGIPSLILEDKRLNIEVILKNNFANLVDGHKVLVELTKQIDDKKFVGTVIKIIGHKNDPDIDILTIASKYGIELDKERINFRK